MTVFANLQHLLPLHLASRAVGLLCRLEAGPVSRLAMRLFIAVYRVDLRDAADPRLSAYPSFNAFFTRALDASARPPGGDESTLVSPADGTVSQCGAIEGGTLIQAKGIDYSLENLMGGDRELARLFEYGHFITIYLAPHDYHRVHFPLTGTLHAVRYVPGALFSVNDTTARRIPRLFCRNERVAAVFASASDWFALVMVGALNVGSIELTVPGPQGFRNRPAANLEARQTRLTEAQPVRRSAEFGRFNMGSTVILLTSRGFVEPDPDCRAGSVVRMGQALGRVRAAA